MGPSVGPHSMSSKPTWAACPSKQAPFLPSLFLFRLGLAPQIHDLYGRVKFTGKTGTLAATSVLGGPLDSG